MNIKKLKEIFSSFFLIILSSLLGFRVVNEFLRINDISNATYEASYRNLDNGKSIFVAHPKDYEITSTGKNTIILISDSFGEGEKCGNLNNISGCLSKANPTKKVINLSRGGTAPAFYLNQLKNYLDDQRKKNNYLSNEQIIVALYSNDIVLDQESCKFYKSKESIINNKLDIQGIKSIKKKCELLLAKSIEQYGREANFSIPFQDKMKLLIGDYSFLFVREMIAQLSLIFSKHVSVGRAGYIPKWEKIDLPEIIILAEILKEMSKTCEEFKCNLFVATFPNVENLSPESEVRLAYQKFANFINTNYKINIYDGYTPFVERGIKNATWSLTDIHANCIGYEIYANWLDGL